jgi:hypothetical protein
MIGAGINIFRYGSLLLLFAGLSACATSGMVIKSKSYKAFRSKTAIEDRITVTRVSAPAADMVLEADTILESSPVLGVSPLEMPNTVKISPMLQLFKRVKTLASVRHNGLTPADLFVPRNARLKGMKISRRLVYKNWKDLYADFKFVPHDRLRLYANETDAGIALIKWSTMYYFDLAPDHKAYRVILASAHFIEHRRPEVDKSESRGPRGSKHTHKSPQKKPINDFKSFFGAVTYRYPNNGHGDLSSMSVVFKLFQGGRQEVYTGGNQTSGWLPLQSTDKVPYNLYFTLVHASNVRSLLDRAGGFNGLILRFLGLPTT